MVRMVIMLKIIKLILTAVMSILQVPELFAEVTELLLQVETRLISREATSMLTGLLAAATALLKITR